MRSKNKEQHESNSVSRLLESITDDSIAQVTFRCPKYRDTLHEIRSTLASEVRSRVTSALTMRELRRILKR